MSRITLYTTQFCGYCRAAKQLLLSKGYDFDEISVDWNADLREEMVERSGGGQTVPQIFIDGRHVGGYQDLAALDRSHTLDAWLAAEPDLAEAPFVADAAKA